LLEHQTIHDFAGALASARVAEVAMRMGVLDPAAYAQLAAGEDRKKEDNEVWATERVGAMAAMVSACAGVVWLFEG
jgi:hypothetical protein